MSLFELFYCSVSIDIFRIRIKLNENWNNIGFLQGQRGCFLGRLVICYIGFFMNYYFYYYGLLYSWFLGF